MEKINWINGQAGGTPLSAENLNQMQDNIEKAINENTEAISHRQNIITAKGASSADTLAPADGAKVELVSAISVGTKLTLENGGIKIGANVKTIKVSATTTYTANFIGQHALWIYKNVNSLENRVARALMNTGDSTYVQPTINIIEQITNNISEGDILYVYASSSSNVSVSNSLTMLTVEVVE